MNRRVFGGRVPLPIAVLGGIGAIILLIILLNLGAIFGAVGDAAEFVIDPGSRDHTVIACEDSQGCQIIHPIVYSLVLIVVILTGFAYTTLLERKLLAYFQNRVGPNRVGPGGFLQPLADGIKLIFKEDIVPAKLASRPVYYMAPMLKVIPVLVVLAVIPLGPPIIVPWFDGNWYQVPLQLFDTGVAVLWILAITSISTYGVVLAGWSSNNKYSMLGGMRAASQMVSYELSMGIALAVPVMIAGSMSLIAIVEAQGDLLVNWMIFQNPLAAIILMVALLAETNRAPFDLPEAEQELTAGYMTEYSGMKFAMFMLAEYVGMITVSLIAATMFLGGYQDGFGLVDAVPVLGPLVVIGKVVLLLVGMIWIRATLPRIRYDRLMAFGWKVLLPLALLSVVWTAVAVVVGEELGQFAYVVASGVMFVLVLAGGVLILGDGERNAEAEDDEFDPVVTGERDGIGWAVLQFVGGLVAIPFVLYQFTLTQLDNLAKLAPEEEDEDGPAPRRDTNLLDGGEGDDQTALPSEAGD